ncbi:cytochrome C assembly family protein [Candidatus Vondammii sp. HM_W22]|uniref:cytochrome C assembly family protein n=1 Tax=Candidatus Vondammii sp. HM_W22 TaxID=2687299 RepID=UPI001F147996|nr:cytochrome c biogenesis protein CcsA [Candidatus Vondammii sp. HM_W22]
MSTTIIAFLAIASYAASGIVISVRLFHEKTETNIPRPVGIGLGLAGVLLHGTILYQGIISDSGINLGFYAAFSLIAWSILLLLMLSAVTKPVENLGIFLLPLAILSILLEMHFSTAHLFPADASWGLRVHVLISLLAYSLLAMASVQAVLLAVHDHHLHHRHPGGFIRALPPLITMETLLFEMIGLGFVLLTIGLISGFIFLENILIQRLAHKTILSIVAWFVFGTLLWGRFRFGWRGQKALIWTLIGFVVLMLAYFGSKFVVEVILGVNAG